MAESLYQQVPPDRAQDIHRGDIYQFRPVHWLQPPLVILRNVQWRRPCSADLHRATELGDAFRRSEQDHEEDVMARAKNRYVVVLSNDIEAANLGAVTVAPAYTITATKPNPALVTKLRTGSALGCFYLPRDPAFPQMVECYLDLRKLQPLDKRFLAGNKLPICLTATAIAAVLQRYIDYLHV